MFLENISFSICLIIAIALCLLVIISLIVFLIIRKKKTRKLIIDDEFIDNLISLLGGKDNINNVMVDNGRLKFDVNDVEIVNLNGLKEIATSGVFITGNTIKTLFKLDSLTIQKALHKKI